MCSLSDGTIQKPFSFLFSFSKDLVQNMLIFGKREKFVFFSLGSGRQIQKVTKKKKKKSTCVRVMGYSDIKLILTS